MMNRVTPLSLYIYALLLMTCFIAQISADNTHQTISTNLPKLLKLNVVHGDNVRISVFNTNSQFQILFQMNSQQLALSEQNICFVGEQCSLQFESQWDAEGVVMIQVMGYEYSYEIIHNDKVIKREENVVTNFIGGKFIYYKNLQPQTYTLRVSYQSQFVPKIVLEFSGFNYTIKANQVNEVSISIDQPIPFYEFHFKFGSGNLTSMTQHLFSIDIELPNSMLKGCDGSNVYDPKTRVCPLTNVKVREDSMVITRLGQYPTFEVNQQQNVSIKITIIEHKKWQQFFNQQFLTLYVANTSNSHEFYGLNKFQIGTRYRTRQQCLMSGSNCTFTFLLQRGNYSVMPVFPRSSNNAFVYLFERSIGGKTIQSYYSLMPTLSEIDKKFYQVGTMIEFVNNKEKLTELVIECEDAFILLEYSILKRSNAPNEMGQMGIEITDMSQSNLFNKDLHRATIYLELQPNQTYLIFIGLISQKKIKEAKALQAANDESLIDFEMEDDVGASYEAPEQIEQPETFFYLETASISLSIRNGKFPHRKLQKLQQQQKHLSTDDTRRNQSRSQSVSESIHQQSAQPIGQSQEQSSSGKGIYVLAGIVASSILLFLLYKFLYSGQNEKDMRGRELVTEQATGNVTIGDSSIEISQIIKTQSQQSNEISSRDQPETQLKA